MKSDVNGCSTCATGSEQYEMYPHPFKKRVELCQYDYRHTDGELFSCVAPSLEAARAKRDQWLASKAA